MAQYFSELTGNSLLAGDRYLFLLNIQPITQQLLVTLLFRTDSIIFLW